jgi:hypothetical protein
MTASSPLFWPFLCYVVTTSLFFIILYTRCCYLVQKLFSLYLLINLIKIKYCGTRTQSLTPVIQKPTIGPNPDPPLSAFSPHNLTGSNSLECYLPVTVSVFQEVFYQNSTYIPCLLILATCPAHHILHFAILTIVVTCMNHRILHYLTP